MKITNNNYINNINIEFLKKSTATDQYIIPIINKDNIEIGYLYSLNIMLIENKIIIESMTKWRNLFMRYFMTQFTATDERTERWLRDVILPSADRLFFLIYDSCDNLVGHIGVCNIIKEAAEIDNIIRGSRQGDPQLVYFAETCLLNWLFNRIGVSTVILRVFSSNIMAINLHKEVGFNEIRKVPLYKKTTDESIIYSEDCQGGELVCFSTVYMGIEKGYFFSRHKLSDI